MSVLVPELDTPRRARRLTELRRTLPNGLEVIAVRKPGVPLVELRLRVPFFSPRAGHSAVAEVLAETALTGTATADRTALAIAIQSLGGDLGVGVDADRLVVSGNVLSSNLPKMLGILGDVLTSASYPAPEVNAERERMVERLVIARSRAGTIAAQALARRMWGDHPYARDLPQVPEVEVVTRAKVRTLAESAIRPEGATLVVVGDISPSKAIDQIAGALAGWTGAPKPQRLVALPTIEPGPITVIDRPGSVQSSIRLGGVALPRTDPRFPALQLANLIFGGYFSSRWNENIREDKGYTYGPHSRLDHHTLGSSLRLDADVATEVTAPALLETWYELGRLAALPVTENELASARQYAVGTMALSTATQAGLASTLSGLAAQGLDADWLAGAPARLAGVTIEQVQQAAAEFFAPSRLVTIVVGDAQTILGPLGLLSGVVTAEAP